MPPWSAAWLTRAGPSVSLVLGGAGDDDRPAAMDVRVDAAGDDDLARGIDGAAGAERGEAPRRADRGDLAAGNADIGRLRPRWQNGETAGNDNVEHREPPYDDEPST